MGFFQKYPVKRVVCLFLRFSFQNKSNFSLKIKIYPDNNIILPRQMCCLFIFIVFYPVICVVYFILKKYPVKCVVCFSRKKSFFPVMIILPRQMCRLFFLKL